MITHFNSSDPSLTQIISRVGDYSITYRSAEFASLVRSIVFQQLSGKSARPIYERLDAACDGKVVPENILKLHPAKLRKIGLSRQKASYIRDLAKRTASGEIDFAALPKMSDE